jgi:hypothetical protein
VRRFRLGVALAGVTPDPAQGLAHVRRDGVVDVNAVVDVDALRHHRGP